MKIKLDYRSMIGLSVIWFFIAIIIDRYLLKDFFWYSELFVLKNAEFAATSFSRRLSWFGLTSAILVPAVFASIIWSIINLIRKKINLNGLFGHLGNIIKWIGVAFILIWLGDIVYRLIFKGVLGDWKVTKGLVEVLDNIYIKADLYLLTKYIFSFAYNLGAIAGLILGTGILLKKTFWNYVINDAKTKLSWFG